MAYVTILNQFYRPDISPTAHLSASLAEYLADEGHDVTVVTSRGGYTRDAAAADRNDDDASAPDNPKVHRVWTPRLGKSTIVKRCIDYGTFYLGAFWRMLTTPRQDVIIALTTPPYIAWTGAMHKLLHPDARLVLWTMDCYPDAAERMNVIRTGGLLSRLLRWLNRRLFKRLDHLIVLDTAMKDLLLGQYADQADAPPTTIIPNWEDAALFPRDATHEPWEKASALGLDDKFVVLYLGNTGYGHHFDSTLDAAERLRDEPVAFLFIGGGKRWTELEAEKTRRGLDNVFLHPYVPKESTPNVMAAADCALITLRDNSLGVMSPSKMHSNLAMGLPIVYLGPETSNVDDAIRRFGCGVSLRGDDSAGLVDFIRRHIDRGDDYRDLRRRARHAFDHAYVDERTLPQFEAVIAGLLRPDRQAATVEHASSS